MSVYNVNFGDYSLVHCTDEKHFKHFELHGKKYNIGSSVTLTEKGMSAMFYNGVYSYKKGDFRLVDYYIDSRGKERWVYLIGWYYNNNMPKFYSTTVHPDELVSAVFSTEINVSACGPVELKVEFKESNYFPKETEIPNLFFGWVIFIAVWIIALLFDDWWIKLIVQIAACVYFSNWRSKQINEAISSQKFKKW